MSGSIDPLILIYGGLFLAALLAVEGVFMLFDGDSALRRAANRRMRLRASGHSTDQVVAQLRRTDADGNRRLKGPLGALDILLGQAGASLSAPVAALLMAVGAGLTWLALTQLRSVEPVMAAALALGLAIGAPVMVLRLRRQARLRRFGQQLPDALDMAVRALRAGHPVGSALRLISDQMPDPVGSEFGLMCDEMTYGLDLREALDNLSRRVGAPEVGFMVVAINIQHQAGGNLAEILAGLARVIRDRIRMTRRIRAVSAEGRFSAYIITGLPFVVGAAINVINPGFFGDVADDAMFLPGLGILGVLLGLGILTVFRMVQIRI